MDIETLKTELNRCIGCKPRPCEKACPLGVSPHDFIALAKAEGYKESAKLIAQKNPLPQTCGLVCPDCFCQKACIRGRMDSPIKIPCLQAKMIQLGGLPELELPEPNGKKVAVIGGGPAGIGATYELISNGYNVTIYEKADKLGGVARLIPEYRLPKSVLDEEIARITENDRVIVKLNTEITDFALLKQEYDDVILALGEPLEYKLNVVGDEACISYKDVLKNNAEDITSPVILGARRQNYNWSSSERDVSHSIPGIHKQNIEDVATSYDGNLAHPQFKTERDNTSPSVILEAMRQHQHIGDPQTSAPAHNHDGNLAHPHIIIVGGGEVALDCALSLKKLHPNATVEMFVRRRREDMRIMKRDHIELDEHNIIIRDLTSIVEIKEENNLYNITAIHNEINEEGKARAIKGSEFPLQGYTHIITALGSYFPKDKDTNDCHCAGDMTGSCGTVVQAIASGIKSAKAIMEKE